MQSAPQAQSENHRPASPSLQLAIYGKGGIGKSTISANCVRCGLRRVLTWYLKRYWAARALCFYWSRFSTP